MRPAKLTATIIGGTIPDHAHVGDTIAFRGQARIVSMREDLVDVTGYHSERTDYIPSGLEVELLIHAMPSEEQT